MALKSNDVAVLRRLAAESTRLQMEFVPGPQRGYFTVDVRVNKGAKMHGYRTVINDDAPLTVSHVIESALLRFHNSDVDIP